MLPKPAPMTPLSQRLRQSAAIVGIGSLATTHEGNASSLKQAHDLMREAADRLDALAALRPGLVEVRKAFEFEEDCGEPECGDCCAFRTLRDLLALLPEEGPT